MWSLCILTLACAITYCFAHDTDVYTVQYSSESFPVEVPKNNHFVMFYAPWCGHCSKLAPTWEELAEMLNKDEDSPVTVAKVDCTVESSLCSDHDVTGYPTLKFFKIGESDGLKFRGPRDLSSFTVFINEQLGNTEQEPEAELKSTLLVNGLIELTEDSFPKHVEKGQHFIKFYAPWCGHCQKLAPTWENLAKSLQFDTTVTVGKVDCTVHRSVCNQFEIKGYPTLLWIEDGKKVEKYQGARTHEELKNFVDSMSRSKMSGNGIPNIPSGNNSPVVTFSTDNFDHGIANGVSFVKFFAPWCGHCKRLAPTWDELGKKFAGSPHVKIIKVDCTSDTSREVCTTQEVDGFPSLFLYKDGKKVGEYTGSRNLDDLYDYVKKHVPHDEL